MQPKSGARQNRIMGTADSSYSYVYFKIADVDVTLESGDKLIYSAWFDNVAGGHPIAVDLKFSDGTWMRDGNFVDQNGINAHPGQRNVYQTRQWLTFVIDLSKKAGKRVTRVVVAYDNGSIHTTGAFRAYVDDISIGPNAVGGSSLGYTAVAAGGYESSSDGGCGSIGLDLLWPLGLLYLWRRRKTRP